MKNASFLLSFLCMLACGSCAGQKRTTVKDTTVVADSVQFYDTEYETRQKNYRQLLQGGWVIRTMKRQAKAEEENLSGVYLQFYEDSTFNGNAGCNRISGKYTIKGTSIKFSNIISTRMACDKLEQESAYLKLLEETVSAYTVSGTELLLRDGASNVVFAANRRE